MEETQRVPSPEHQQLFDDTIRRVIDHGCSGMSIHGPARAAFLTEHMKVAHDARQTLINELSEEERRACLEVSLGRYRKPISA